MRRILEVMTFIDRTLITPRTPVQDPGSATSTPRPSKLLDAQTLADRFEGQRKPVDDPLRNHGRYTIMTPSDRIDGFLVGADGRLYPPELDIDALPGVKASGRTSEVPASRRVELIHVNGIGTPAAGQFEDMRATADSLSKKGGVQAEIRGIHNGTDGAIKDVLQAAQDKFGFGSNRAVTTLKEQVLQRLKKGEPTNLMVHSHGTIIASRALREAKLALMLESGMTKSQAEQKMGEHVRVLTTGNASWRYPDGPKYLHVMNTRDKITVGLGLGSHPDVPKADGMGAVRVGGKALAGAGRLLRGLFEGDRGGTYQPGRDSMLWSFETNVPKGAGGGAATNHSYQHAYLPEIRSKLAEVMGTPDQGGFFLTSQQGARSSAGASAAPTRTVA